MAPAVSGHSYKDYMSSAHKLRKPLVEKLHRDRINSSIEQLKALLGPEFLLKQPDSKQEKVDVLEMTLVYLKTWQQQRVHSPAPSQRPAAHNMRTSDGHTAHNMRTSSEGFSRCVQEVVSFMSQSELQTQAHRRLLGHLQSATLSRPLTPPVTPPESPLQPQYSKVQQGSTGLWRPW